MWTSLANGLRNFSCSSQYQSRSFLDSYLQNGHNFIQCICDGKHKRTKVMDLNGESDYFATFQFKARDSAPQNCLSSLQAEEAKQQIFKPYQSIQFPSQLSLVSCQPYKDTMQFFFFAIHCCPEYFGLLVRYLFWISNSSEAENCTKKQTNERINLLLENSKFCNYKVAKYM